MSDGRTRAAAAAARRRAAALLLLCTTTLGGCYRYVPAGAVPTEMRGSVRVTLTDDARTSLEPVIGTGVVAMEGDVVDASASALTLRVARLLTAARVPVDWTGAPVRVPVEGIATMERRELARRQTVLLAGGMVLGALLLGTVIGSAASDGGGPGPGPIQP